MSADIDELGSMFIAFLDHYCKSMIVRVLDDLALALHSEVVLKTQQYCQSVSTVHTYKN